MITRLYRLWLIGVLSVAASCWLKAQSDAPAWRTELGAGLITTPTFRGADDYQVLLVPDVRVSYGEAFSASIARGARYVAWSDGATSIGPLVRLDFGRDADGDSPFRIAGDDPVELRGLHEVDTTVQAGAFVQHRVGDWSVEAEVLQGVNGHEGLTVDLSFDYTVRLTSNDGRKGPPAFLVTGPRVQWANSAYHDAYFGVTTADVVTSGLPYYAADGGVGSAGWGLRYIRPVSRQAVLIAFAGYDKLLGSAADSPLVRLRGDTNQFSAGVFVSFKL